MPDQPENRTEEWLQAYARKRRGQAEDSGSWTLEPATRRRLHAEVSHHYRAGKPQNSTGSWWRAMLLLWPRLGVALGLFLGLGLLIWSYLRQTDQPLEMAKNTPSSDSTEEMARPSTPAVTFEKPRNAAEGPNQEAELKSLSASRPATISASPARLAQTPPSSAPAEAPLGKKVSGPGARGFSPKALGQSQSGLTNPESKLEATKQSFFTYDTHALGLAVSRLDFKSSRDRSVSPQASEPGGKVLDRFEMEQAGSRLRIIDADGSVYEGEWLAANPSVLGGRSDFGTEGLAQDRIRRAVPPKFPNPSPTLPLASPEKGAPQALAENSENLVRVSVPSERRFTVSGTNHTLNQPVQFSGVMLLVATNEDVKAGTAAEFGIPPDASRKLGQDLRFTDSVSSSTSSTNFPWSIRGTAKLGESMLWEIRASQVRPER
jgi:hypothetical protein